MLATLLGARRTLFLPAPSWLLHVLAALLRLGRSTTPALLPWLLRRLLSALLLLPLGTMAAALLRARLLAGGLLAATLLRTSRTLLLPAPGGLFDLLTPLLGRLLATLLLLRLWLVGAVAVALLRARLLAGGLLAATLLLCALRLLATLLLCLRGSLPEFVTPRSLGGRLLAALGLLLLGLPTLLLFGGRAAAGNLRGVVHRRRL